jgi:hypothetical protein
MTDPEQPTGLHESLRTSIRESALHWLVLGLGFGAALSVPAYRAFVATSLATRSPVENLVAQTHGVFYLLGQLVRVDRLNADPALPAVTALVRQPSGRERADCDRRAPLAAKAVLRLCRALDGPHAADELAVAPRFVNDRQWYGALFRPALL